MFSNVDFLIKSLYVIAAEAFFDKVDKSIFTDGHYILVSDDDLYNTFNNVRERLIEIKDDIENISNS